MTKKLQDLQEVQKNLNEVEKDLAGLDNAPMDKIIDFLQKCEPIEIALKKAARCPKTDEEKALAKEVKAQYQGIQKKVEKIMGGDDE